MNGLWIKYQDFVFQLLPWWLDAVQLDCVWWVISISVTSRCCMIICFGVLSGLYIDTKERWQYLFWSLLFPAAYLNRTMKVLDLLAGISLADTTTDPATNANRSLFRYERAWTRQTVTRRGKRSSRIPILSFHENPAEWRTQQRALKEIARHIRNKRASTMQWSFTLGKSIE